MTSPPTSPAPAQRAGPAEPPRWLVLLLAVSCGLTVANLYYAQPLLGALRASFHVDAVTAGTVVTVTQVGYAAGLLLLVPLGDRVENRRLVTLLLTAATAAIAVVGLAPTFPVLLAALLLGSPAMVVAQILLPYAADLAPAEIRGQIVGRVVSGLLLGVLLSRTLGSLVADAAGWRAVYLTSAGLLAVLTLVLRAALPPRVPTATHPYGRLLRSTVRLAVIHPALRRRALYQAAMFGSFSAFWTTISFVLTGPPFHYSQLGVGLFALVGVGGAAVAPWAGRWADRGLSRHLTAAAFVVAAAAFGLAGLGGRHVVALAAAAVLLDAAVQTTFVLGQQVIYQLDDAARARLNSAYMATFFVGGAAGAAFASAAYRAGGWHRVAVLGAALPLVALLWWTTERTTPRSAAGSKNAERAAVR